MNPFVEGRNIRGVIVKKKASKFGRMREESEFLKDLVGHVGSSDAIFMGLRSIPWPLSAR